MAVPRRRSIYRLLLVGVILLGLGSRRYSYLLPHLLKKNAGDALWALAVFLVLAILLPRPGAIQLAAMAFAISIFDEFSQLYHTPWLDGIRGTFVGHLFLGSGFSWSDIGCYAVGSAIGILLEISLALSARRCRSAILNPPGRKPPC
ncbi:MAG TPA: DUF2809 domain-containing protein [Armatimonadota bacterium]|nr:DUF2809 domain-containing protein [Armatimonadota bacterium]